MNELNLEKEALVPTINLAESVHSSLWVFVGSGCKVKIYLYTTTMDDMVRLVLQQQFYHLFLSRSRVGT
jgi:hypothetical protein